MLDDTCVFFYDGVVEGIYAREPFALLGLVEDEADGAGQQVVKVYGIGVSRQGASRLGPLHQGRHGLWGVFLQELTDG